MHCSHDLSKCKVNVNIYSTNSFNKAFSCNRIGLHMAQLRTFTVSWRSSVQNFLQRLAYFQTQWWNKSNVNNRTNRALTSVWSPHRTPRSAALCLSKENFAGFTNVNSEGENWFCTVSSMELYSWTYDMSECKYLAKLCFLANLQTACVFLITLYLLQS